MKPRSLITGILMLLTSLTLACSGNPDAPPEIVVDRTSCTQCGMLISDLRFAVAVRIPDGGEQTFDDVTCYFEARAATIPDGSRVWLYDFESGVPVDSANALLVVQEQLPGPMGGNVLAAGSDDAATRLAAATNGRIVPRLDELSSARGVRQ